MSTLFPDLPIHPELPDASITLLPQWLTLSEANSYFEVLSSGLAWEQQRIKLFGKEVPCPRRSAWHGDKNAGYSYSGLQLEPTPWTRELKTLRDATAAAVEENTKTTTSCDFNSVLANLYRDENDSMGWHSDNEPELGTQPIIASLSLGEERRFSLKHNISGQIVHMDLPHGSLLIMQGDTQSFWKHAIPKRPKPHTPRINLTFRRIVTAEHCHNVK